MINKGFFLSFPEFFNTYDYALKQLFACVSDIKLVHSNPDAPFLIYEGISEYFIPIPDDQPIPFYTIFDNGGFISFRIAFLPF